MTNQTAVEPAAEEEIGDSVETERPETADINIAIRCALRGAVDRLFTEIQNILKLQKCKNNILIFIHISIYLL